MIALIDGDVAAYRCAVAAVEDVDWGDGTTTAVPQTQFATANVVSLINRWTAEAGADETIVCLSSGRCFRHEVYPGYKAGRSEKPPSYGACLEAIKDTFETVWIDGLEADDVMGLLATGPDNVGKSIIVTIDKDLKTVPAKRYDPVKKQFGISLSAAADCWMFYQTLTGDRVDGYPGALGIGDVKARALLKHTPRDQWAQVVEKAFLNRGHDRAFFLSQIRSARILRHGDHSKIGNKVRLWTPPGAPIEWLSLN